MATLDATVGGASSNSYVTVIEADDYFDSRLNSSVWSSSTSKDAALITAAYDLDSTFNWVGEPASETQSMEWPRLYVAGVESTEIPFDVKRAQMELALAYLSGTYSTTQESSLQAVKMGPMEVKFESGSETRVVPDSIATIIGILGSYIEVSSKSARMVDLTR